MASDDTPAVPAPASRSGEDHAAASEIDELLKDAEHLTSIFEYLNRPGNARDAARIEQFIRSIAPLSLDSGEAVRRAQAWPGDDLRQDVLLANGTDLAADVVALFASAARLKTDINDAQAKIVHLGKMAKRECERADDLEAEIARLTEDNKRLREALEQILACEEKSEVVEWIDKTCREGLSPTASRRRGRHGRLSRA